MMNKVFFVHSGNEAFTAIDREILETEFEVNDFHALKKFPRHFGNYWQGARACDVVYCWFASWNSMWTLLFAKLLNKPSVLVIGGYDLADMPEINYGNQRGGVKRWISNLAIRLASTLITNSFYSLQEAESNAKVDPKRINVVYHGVPDIFGKICPNKENLVLTVGNIDSPNLCRKGLEPFVKAAALLPEYQFALVGSWKDDAIDFLKSIATKNVLFTGYVSNKELLEYYRRAFVYVQASLHEGFGMSVAEAMLAGCIPVVTRAGALPEVVGELGFFCKDNSPSSIAEAIRAAFEVPQILQINVRQRIINKFSIESRRIKLLRITKKVIKVIEERDT